MFMKPNLIKPPECVRGMTILDKSKFDTTVTLPILNIKNIKCSDVLVHVKKYSFKMRHLKPFQTYGNGDNYVLLNPEMIQKWTDFEIDTRTNLEDLSITESNLSSTNITVKYENYNADEIFKAVLPQEHEGFSSFSQIGHIAHINLRDHLFPYKKLIAQVLLDSIPNVRAVVNKVDVIHSTYRNFQMEVLGGENDMIVTVKENQCQFHFDFSKVYWNPRLSTEHERIIKQLNSGDVLFDVFAGVGPFSIPAAKKKVLTFANDLNPESYKWLNYNLKSNKINSQYLQTFNKDGREFILNDIKNNLKQYLKTHDIHIVMNLPSLAVEFLKFFYKLYDKSEISDDIKPPTVYVYCFAKGENYIEIAKTLVAKNIECDISDKIIDIFKVRTVSSFKEMMRVSFKLDRDILVGPFTDKRKHSEETVIMANKKVNQIKNKKNKDKIKHSQPKTKAKAINSNLKHMNVKTRQKVSKLDEQLVSLQDKVRLKSASTIDNKTKSNACCKHNENKEVAQQKSQQMVDDLNQMQL